MYGTMLYTSIDYGYFAQVLVECVSRSLIILKIHCPTMLFRFTNRTIACVLHSSINVTKYFEEPKDIVSTGLTTFISTRSSGPLLDVSYSGA